MLNGKLKVATPLYLKVDPLVICVKELKMSEHNLEHHQGLADIDDDLALQFVMEDLRQREKDLQELKKLKEMQS